MNEALLKRVLRVKPYDYLNAAKQTAVYVRSQEKYDEDGMYWVASDDSVPPHGHIDFYHGSSGIIQFFLILADATGDASYLEDAKRGGMFMVNKLKKYGTTYLNKKKDDLPQYQTGAMYSFLAGGVAGIAYTLSELDLASPDPVFHDMALSLTEEIAEHAVSTEGGIKWSGRAPIAFDGGTILYMLYAGKRFGRPEWIEMAHQAALAIVKTGRKMPTGGTRYCGEVNTVKIMTGIDDPNCDTPNFFYGTAGISYMMAAVAKETNDADLLAAAKEGADYVMGLAVEDGDAALVPFRIPDKGDLFYLSMCHGTSGTGKLFYILDEMTGEKKYGDFLRKMVNGMLEIGAPEMHSPGYWHTDSWCCGGAGMAFFLTGLYLKYHDELYLTTAKRCGDVIIGDAESGEKGGICWYQAFHRVKPDDITCEPGFGCGASGIGAALALIAMAEEGKAPALRQPDEPYISAR